MRVDVHAVDVGEEDAFALGGGEGPRTGGGGDGRVGGRAGARRSRGGHGRGKRVGDNALDLVGGVGGGFVDAALFGPLLGGVFGVVAEIPGEQEIIGARRKVPEPQAGSRTARVSNCLGVLSSRRGPTVFWTM